MSARAFRAARRVRLVSDGRVRYLSAERHECRDCWLTWNPLKLGPLCPVCTPQGDAA